MNREEEISWVMEVRWWIIGSCDWNRWLFKGVSMDLRLHQEELRSIVELKRDFVEGTKMAEKQAIEDVNGTIRRLGSF